VSSIVANGRQPPLTDRGNRLIFGLSDRIKSGSTSTQFPRSRRPRSCSRPRWTWRRIPGRR